MDVRVYLDSYLDTKARERTAIFADAASTSILMHSVQFLCQHFYNVFDWYCRWFMLARLHLRRRHDPATIWNEIGRLYADAIDTYHVLWVFITFFCYVIGWLLYFNEGNDWTDWAAWFIPLWLCTYRVLEILAALVEIYFRPSEAKHHQFRVLLQTSLHYACIGFAFALFYVCADWSFQSFTTGGESQLGEWFEPIYYSLMTVVAFNVGFEPANWLGKLLNLSELVIGFMLVTFIFMNVTQIWTGSRDGE